MVLPSAGARATMRFAQRRAGPGTSNVSASGQSDVLRVATTSASVNALIQARFAVNGVPRVELGWPLGRETGEASMKLTGVQLCQPARPWLLRGWWLSYNGL
jgi:hypothetical protein